MLATAYKQLLLCLLRCVCPGWSWGPRCKVLSRTFSGSGWAWVQPLPPCLPMTVSVHVLPRHTNGLILYTGPLSPTSHHPGVPTIPMLVLQVVAGQPQVLVDEGGGTGGPVKLQVNTTLTLGTWHTLHLHLNTQVTNCYME